MTTIDDAVAQLAAHQHGVFTAQQFHALNGTRAMMRHRLDQRRWRAVDRHVYAIAGAPDTWRQRLLAAVLAVRNESVGARRSAASLLQVPGFPSRPIEVLVLRPCQTRSALGVVRQTKLLKPSHCTEVDHIPVTNIPRTIFDLAGTLRPGRTERALDHALAHGLARIEGFWDVFMDLARRGRSGTVVMRALLMARGAEYVAPESELEALFLQLLRDYRLPMPDQQVDFGDEDGWIGRVDFRIPGTTLVVETDGRRYHSALLDTQNDARRDERLNAMGLMVLRLTWHDIVERPAACAARILAELASIAAHPPVRVGELVVPQPVCRPERGRGRDQSEVRAARRAAGSS